MPDAVLRLQGTKTPATSGLFRLIFALFHLLALAPLWVGHYLPMVDLPQHAAQLSIGWHWDDPVYGYQQFYELNPFFTHRLVAALASLLGSALPLAIALKVVLSLTILGVGWTCLLWIREVGGDPWWSLPAFAAGYGYPFFLGFLNFLVATPLAMALMLVGYRFTRLPSRRRGVAMVALVYLLFFTHILMLGFAGLVTTTILVFGAADDRVRWRGLGYLATILPAIAAWFAFDTSVPGNSVGAFSLFRVLTAPRFVVGGYEGVAGAVVGLVLLATPWLAGGKPSRQAARWALIGAAALFFLLAPDTIVGTALIYQRFAIFLVPGLLIAFDAPSRPSLARQAVPAAIAAVWLVTLAWNFRDFHREHADFRQVIASTEPHRRLLSIVANPESRAAPWRPYLHFGSWYQVEKGGVADFSFAEFFPNRFRYRPEEKPDLPFAFGWQQEGFSWSRHDGERWDYFLVRGAARGGADLFAGATTTIQLVAESGDWRLYEQTAASPP